MDNIPTSRKATIEIPVKVDQKKLDSFNKALTRMNRGGGNVQKTMEKLSGQLDSFDKRAETFANSYKKTSDKVSNANRDMLKSNKDYSKNLLSSSNQQISNNNKLVKSHANVKSKLDSLSASGDKLIRTGQSMSLASLGIGAAFLKGAKDATALQHQYKVITNLATYGGEKQSEAIHNVSQMQKQGEQYSLKYGVAQQKLSAGYEELIRRGYSTNQALAAQKTFLQGALASGDDYTDVVHNATAAIESFGLKTNNTAKMAENSKKVVNQMAYAADLTATDFNGMGEAMKYVGASAHSANQSVSGTASAIGVLSNAGIKHLSSQSEMVA